MVFSLFHSDLSGSGPEVELVFVMVLGHYVVCKVTLCSVCVLHLTAFFVSIGGGSISGIIT